MQQLSEHGTRVVDEIARRHGFSTDAVTTMLHAVASGYGTQAQFNHPEFGGMGQWSSGGMIMIGDMFNNSLAGRVSSLCQDLSNALGGSSGGMFATPPPAQSGSSSTSGASLFVPNSGAWNWWPGDLGSPAATGAQNTMRYAYFPAARRLAVDIDGAVTVYDTGPHDIGGFSQQQSGDRSVTFSSQLGMVRVADLAVVNSTPLSTPATPSSQPAPSVAPAIRAMTDQVASPPLATSPGPAAVATGAAGSAADILALIEKLGDLHAKGILTAAEFETKKTELLARL